MAQKTQNKKEKSIFCVFCAFSRRFSFSQKKTGISFKTNWIVLLFV